MKPLSETYKELGIAFGFPIVIKNALGDKTYYEDRDGYCCKCEYDSRGNMTYIEDNKNYWRKREYDSNDKLTYFENSDGVKKGTPRSAKTCEGKVIEVDGIKYELRSL